MQLIYIVTCLNVYLLHMSAVCQAGPPPDRKKQPAVKLYTLETAAAEWEKNSCIFPDKSWYKQSNKFIFDDAPGDEPKLGLCQKLDESDLKKNDPDVIFKKQLCQAFYQTSLYLCRTEKQHTFVETCLSPSVLKNISQFDTGTDICSYMEKVPADYYTYLRNKTLCAQNCQDSSDSRNVCELYAIIYYQYLATNNCWPLKETITETTPAKTGIKDTLEDKSLNETSDGGKIEKNKTPQPTSTSLDVDANSMTASTTVATMTDKLTSQTPELGSPQNKLTAKLPEEIVATTILLETSTVVSADSKIVEPSTSLSVDTQLTSTSKPIIIKAIKSIPKPDKVDTVSTADLNTTPESEVIDDDDTLTNTDNDKSPEKNEEEETKIPADQEKKIPASKVIIDQPNDNDEDQVDNDTNKKQPKEKLKKKEPNELSANTDIDGSPWSGHFLAYFLTAVVICISGYVIYHNKQKILAFVIEGRNSGRNGRQRSKDVKYTQLKSNVEEVLPSLEQTATTKNFVY